MNVLPRHGSGAPCWSPSVRVSGEHTRASFSSWSHSSHHAKLTQLREIGGDYPATPVSSKPADGFLCPVAEESHQKYPSPPSDPKEQGGGRQALNLQVCMSESPRRRGQAVLLILGFSPSQDGTLKENDPLHQTFILATKQMA